MIQPAKKETLLAGEENTGQQRRSNERALRYISGQRRRLVTGPTAGKSFAPPSLTQFLSTDEWLRDSVTGASQGRQMIDKNFEDV